MPLEFGQYFGKVWYRYIKLESIRARATVSLKCASRSVDTRGTDSNWRGNYTIAVFVIFEFCRRKVNHAYLDNCVCLFGGG